MPPVQRSFENLLSHLAERAGEADGAFTWPESSWLELCGAGVCGWCIPAEYGGRGLGATELLSGYERVAQACLTTCFILSQHDAACRRLRDGSNETLRRELLPPLARGETFATVGLSQLTTSRQHGKPAMTARERGDAFILDGLMPWVTGASRADHLITGAVLDDGRQIMAALPRQTEGVSVALPLDLMALEGSLTAEVRCENVVLERRWMLAGPKEKVMAAGGRGGTGGLETSILALGLTSAAIEHLSREGETRAEWRLTAARLARARDSLREEIHRLAERDGTAEDAARVRGRANALVLRAVQASLIASKGTGFLRSHPAQRWARQALFFLVWSCPRSAAEATLAELVSDDGACL